MADKVGQQIGNYRLVRLLGSGGFADVYLGQHVHLASKQAAIKVLHLFDVDVQKFQEEAETTEQLVHPHIIRLLDFDLEQGTPFLVLDYAPGGTLRARHPKGSQLPLDTVVGYLKEITPALQYAHGLNILHRDIKPGNMLIGRQGELLLSDFGMAVLSQTGRTSMQNYNVGGTPLYMAPEQYRGKPEKASDQYALAIVVYEWLCGTVPFSEGSFIELGYQHTHEPVPPMREKIPSIPSEVEVVVMRALAKDPKQRFGSVMEFSTAFEQACIPPAQPAPSVTEPARPQSTPSVVVPETITRQPPQPGAAIPAGVQLTTSRPITRRNVLIGLGGAGLAATCIGLGWWVDIHGLLIPAGTTLYTYRGHSELVLSLAWSPDSNRIASASYDGTVQVWDAANGSNAFTYRGHSSFLFAVAWSPDGKRIASGSQDKTVQVWDAANGGNVFTYRGHSDSINSVAWSPDGKRIASGSYDRVVQVWDATTGGNAFTYRGHSGSVWTVAWSPDGKRIASGSGDGSSGKDDFTAQVWDATTGANLVTYKGHSKIVRSVAWSPDSHHIVSGSDDGTAQVWDAITGGHSLTYPGYEPVAWSPAGKLIASGSLDGMQVWDFVTGDTVLTYHGQPKDKPAISAEWSPNGQRIASGGYDNKVYVWQAP